MSSISFNILFLIILNYYSIYCREENRHGFLPLKKVSTPNYISLTKRVQRDAKSNSQEDCSSNITVSSRTGELTSPGYEYPGIYPPNAHCQWLLSAPQDSTIFIRLVDINIEDISDCISDSLEIYSGSRKDQSRLLKRLCGTQKEFSLEIASNKVLIIFRSDPTLEEKGFKIHYKLGKATKPATGHLTTGTREHPCYQKLTNLESEINFPRGLSNHADCDILIEVPKGEIIFLRILELQIDCSDARVSIYDGPTIANTKLGLFCSIDSIESLKSTKNVLLLHFHSETTYSGQKFLARYTTKGFEEGNDNTGPCTWWKGRNEGHIWSPRYPYDYPVNSHCVINLHAPKGHIISVDFTVLQLEAHESCLNDFVQIRQGEDKNDKSDEKKYCGKHEDKPGFKSSGNFIEIRFESDEDMSAKGFFIHYRFIRESSSYECGVPVKGNPINTRRLSPEINPRIAGGKTAEEGAHPWQVMFWEPRAKVFCGGTLLNDRWVVSAAHCFVGQPPVIGFDWKTVQIRLGKYKQSEIEPHEFSTRIKEVQKQPKYNDTIHDNDISLVKLQDPVAFTDYIIPICLGDYKTINEGIFRSDDNKGVATGWGNIIEDGGTPDKLKEVLLPIINQKDCEKSDGRVTSNMFCAGYDQGTVGDTCQGDSGGPLSVNLQGQWYLAGVVSWGEGCDREGKFGIYTKVINYHKWINFYLADL